LSKISSTAVTASLLLRQTHQMPSSAHTTDFELLEAARAGDADAFGAFYERHREALLGYLARRVDQPEAAVDLMAESFASALAAVRKPDRPLPAVPVAWLFLIAKNLLIDSYRRGRVEAAARRRLGIEPLVLTDDDLERVGEIAEAHDLTREVANVLSDDDWQLFRAHVLDEEPYPDLARSLNCSEVVLRKRVSRAKSRLRTALGGPDV
jgi:RNA polymerase sigma factor (sigma-70 family)